jgi:hypothetical protein
MKLIAIREEELYDPSLKVIGHAEWKCSFPVPFFMADLELRISVSPGRPATNQRPNK